MAVNTGSSAKSELTLCRGRLRLVKRIASGNFSDIFLGVNQTNEEVRKRKILLTKRYMYMYGFKEMLHVAGVHVELCGYMYLRVFSSLSSTITNHGQQIDQMFWYYCNKCSLMATTVFRHIFEKHRELDYNERKEIARMMLNANDN